ncbi:carbon-nitrogen hydrolase family protein [Plantactinospora sp. S1510]|uniref:Carbon-nitrogen hydrolase family protein n=1 Tax=Plantactinospora alkalitolerans TaxID=2789879 RepID=A0ABS0GXP2_9ACTN|nr:carbon-nitrogen hydrolase family protein [Plantactinospora alkalitolerans]MBF9130960.1 carbon-nitrogen hydrolase family protein [Plantactinospora alkalitolerans]
MTHATPTPQHDPSAPDDPVVPLTVAAVQAEAVPGDVAGNAVTAARLVERAARAGARLVVLPELFLPAYHPPALRNDPVGTDVAADDRQVVADPRLDPLAAVARDHRVVVLVGAAVRHPDGRRTCSALVVDRSGRVSAGYAKQHLWGPDENELFTAGERGATLLVDGWRLGLGVCYDGCFPEHGRAAAVDGAHGYLCPSGYVVGSEHRRDLYYRARALDNTMYVVFANAVGGAAPWRFNGGAAVYDPEGRSLGRAGDHGEAVVVARLDPVELRRVRDAHRMLADRRADQGGTRLLFPG